MLRRWSVWGAVCGVFIVGGFGLYHYAPSLPNLLSRQDPQAQLAAVLAADRPSLLAGTKLPVVFVHGISDTGATWNDMKSVFKSLGWTDDLLYANTFPCYDFLNCSNVDNAQKIGEWVNKASADHGGSSVILVAHSMGGVSSRYFLLNSSSASKVAAFISFSTMNNGFSENKWWVAQCPNTSFTAVCDQLRRGGNFITDQVWHANYSEIPNINFYSTDDHLVSTYAARMVGACNVRVSGVDHRDIIHAAGVPLVQAKLTEFLNGKSYDKICEPELAMPSVQELANGVKRILVVPVTFADTSANEQRNSAQLNTIFSSSGPVATYYNQVSKGALNYIFTTAPAIAFRDNLLPVSVPWYRTFGGMSEGSFGNTPGRSDLIDGASISDGSASEIDRALCGLKINGQAVNLDDYDGVMVLYQDSIIRHRQAQRLDAGALNNWRNGSGLFLGLGNTVEVVPYDCATGDLKERQYKRTIFLFTGTSWQTDDQIANVAAHELGHTSGFGHANYYQIDYGNSYSLMGGQPENGIGLDGLTAIETGWFPQPGNIQRVTQSGEYFINTVESGIYPVGLSFAANYQPDVAVLERHDGTSKRLALTPAEPQVSGLLAILKHENFGQPVYVVNNQTALIGATNEGLEPGGCDVLDLGDAQAIYRYKDNGTVSVKFSDDPDFSDGVFGCGPDIAIKNIRLSNEPVVGQPTQVSVTVQNVGDKKLLAEYTAALALQFGDDSVPQGDELSGSALEPGKKETLNFTWYPSRAGDAVLEASVPIEPLEKNSSNNTQHLVLTVRPASGQPLPDRAITNTISLRKNGGGGGVVEMLTKSPDGKSAKSYQCDFNAPCDYRLPIGSSVSLSVRPKASVAFTGYSGEYCSGTTCDFTIAGNGTINVNLVPTATVTLAKTGSGSESSNIDVEYIKPEDYNRLLQSGESQYTTCSGCAGKTLTVAAGTQITATAVPTEGQSVYESWTGCSFTTADGACTATAPAVGKDLALTATFKKVVQVSVTAKLLGATGNPGTLVVTQKLPKWTSASEKSFPITNSSYAFVDRYPEGTLLTFAFVHAADQPTTRYRLFQWGSALKCTDTSAPCSVTVGADDLTSTIGIKSQYKVSAGHADTNGSVELTVTNPDQGSLTCPAANTGAGCVSDWYWAGSNIQVKATPNDWYDFGGWASGSCSGMGQTCYQNSLGSGVSVTAQAFNRHTWDFWTGPSCVPGVFIGSLNFENYYCGSIGVNTFVNGNLRRAGLYGESYWIRNLDAQNDRLTFTVNTCQSCERIEVWRTFSGPSANSPYAMIGADEDNAAVLQDKNGKNGYATLNSYLRSPIWATTDQYDAAVALAESSSKHGLGYLFAGNKQPSGNMSIALSALLPEQWHAYMQSALLALHLSVNIESGSNEALVPRYAVALPVSSTTWTAPMWVTRAGVLFGDLAATVRSLPRSVLALFTASKNLAAVTQGLNTTTPDLVARRIYVDSCSDDCVIAPGNTPTLSSVVTNESLVAMGAAYGAKLTIHRTTDTDEKKDLVLYRYAWDGLKAESGTTFSWRDWVPTNGTYILTLAVDDWNNADPEGSNDVLTMTVTVSDAPVAITTGVREAFGGTVSILADVASTTSCAGASCAVNVTQGSTIKLTAVPAANRKFVQWEGARATDCIVTNFATSTCEVVMNNAKTITAYFETDGPQLSVSPDLDSTGSGKVSSTNTGGARNFVNCTTDCTKPFVSDSTVVLTAAADSGSYFSEWTGADAQRCQLSGNGSVCTLTIKKNESSDVHPRFGQGNIPNQKVTIHTYSTDAAGLSGGSVKVLDPLNGDSLLYTCSDDSCTYTVPVPQTSGRPLKIVPVPANGSLPALNPFISPTVDLTPDGRFDQSGCGSFSNDASTVLSDNDPATWLTCAAQGRVTYSGADNQRVTSAEAYMPSISRAADVAAYTSVIKKAVAGYYHLSANDPVISYNTGGLSSVVADTLAFKDIPSNNPRGIAHIGAIPSTDIQSIDVKISTWHHLTTTYDYVWGPASVSGTLYFRIKKTSGTFDAQTYVDLPGPAYPDTYLANMEVDQYVNGSYTSLGTLARGAGAVSLSLAGVEAGALSFKASPGTLGRMRVADIRLKGTYQNPCASADGGSCKLSLTPGTKLVVPVAFRSAVTMLGDVNGDGRVTAADALAALKMSVHQIASTTAADVNCDNKVVASDALAILQASVGARKLISCEVVQKAAENNYGFMDIQVLTGGASTTAELGVVDMTLAQSGSSYVYSGTVNLTPKGSFIGCSAPCIQTSATTFTVPAQMGVAQTASIYLKDITKSFNVSTTTPPVPPPQKLTLCGDADSSGAVTAADSDLALKYAVNKATPGVNALNADANGDGTVTAADALLIQKAVTSGTKITCTKAAAVPPPQTLTLCGDTDSSGSVTTADSDLALKYAVNKATPGVNPFNADANGDGRVTATDALLIQKAVAGSTIITCTKPMVVPPPATTTPVIPSQPPIAPIQPTPTPTQPVPPPPPPAPKMCGDVNNSGTLTSADALAALKIATSGGTSAVADVNGDGAVTGADVDLILKAATAQTALTGCKF